MTDIYASFPPIVASPTVPTYANFAAFPSAASAGLGAEGFALDSDTLYISDGSAWQAVGGAGSIGVGSFDSGTPSAQGAHIDAGNLIMQSASATVPGLVNTSTQTLAGVKTLSSAPILSSLTANTALTANGSKAIVSSATTDTELGYVSGVTSAIQTQLNAKQATLTIGNLTDAGTDGIVVTGGTGAVIGSGTSLAQHVADSTHNGYLSSTDWSTFNAKQAALTIGNLTDAGTDGITVTGGTGAVIGSGTSIAQQVSDASHNGYLSSTDWSTFNGKQASGSYITALTGGVTASGPGSAAATVVTNANLTGVVTSVGNATAIANGAIALAKLATTTAGFIPVGAVTTGIPTYVAMSGDVTIDSTGVTAIGTGKVTSTMILDGTIVNADINGSAAIDGTKLVAAASSVAGAVSTGTQTFTGIKTFETQLIGKGTATNDSASAGYIGEQLGPISRTRSTPVTIASSTNVVNVGNTASITLTPGDWMVTGMVGFNSPSTRTINQFDGAISKTTAALPSADTMCLPTGGEVWITIGFNATALSASGSKDWHLPIAPYRVSVATATTLQLFLVASATFGGSGTLTAYGSMNAWRVR